MSAYLAPIHFRMYDKVRAQEELIDRLAAFAKAEGWLTAEETDSYTYDDPRPLDEIIDQSDIHGWLSARIDDVETRYAEMMAKLLADDAADRMPGLAETAYAYGLENTVEEAPAPALFEGISQLLLDGMPCDGACLIVDSSPEYFAFDLRMDVHAPYWKAAGGNPAVYHELRQEVLRGALENTSLSLAAEDGHTYHFVKD